MDKPGSGPYPMAAAFDISGVGLSGSASRNFASYFFI